MDYILMHKRKKTARVVWMRREGISGKSTMYTRLNTFR